MDTSLRVKDTTYKNIVKTRGAFEQTFGRKLTLDETTFLATSYVNIAYEVFQNLVKEGSIQISIQKDGTPKVIWSDLNNIAEKLLMNLISAFLNYQKMLNEKEQTPIPVTVGG